MAHYLTTKTPFSQTIKNKCFFLFQVSLSHPYRSSSPLSNPTALLLFLIVELLLSPNQTYTLSLIRPKQNHKRYQNKVFKHFQFCKLDISITWEWLLLTPPNNKHLQNRTKKRLKGCTITKASHIRKVNKQ